MKRGLLVLLAMCAFAVAIVPGHRRAVNTEKEKAPPKNTGTACAHETPCAWSIYDPSSKVIQTNITNTYCTCGDGTVCKVKEDDVDESAYVHKCRKPSEGDLFS